MTGMNGSLSLSSPTTTGSMPQHNPPHSCSMLARTPNWDLNRFENPGSKPWTISHQEWHRQLMRHDLHLSRLPMTWLNSMMPTDKRAPKYNVRDKVWLSSENIKMTRPMKKLDYKWLGPYAINQVISRSAYRLKLPLSFSQIHPVFSVTLL